jgi:hypothetical protein
MPNKLHIFIDESGNAGITFNKNSDKNSTSHFVVGAAIFPWRNWVQCTQKIKIVFSGKKIQKPYKEMKFFGTNDEDIKHALEQIVRHKGTFNYLYIDKERVKDSCKNLITPLQIGKFKERSVYDKMVLKLIRDIVKQDERRHTLAYIHRVPGKRVHKQAALTYLKNDMNKFLYPFTINASYYRSEDVFGIQCADVLCGSVRYKLEENDDEFYEIIKSNIIIEKEFSRQEITKK